MISVLFLLLLIVEFMCYIFVTLVISLYNTFVSAVVRTAAQFMDSESEKEKEKK